MRFLRKISSAVDRGLTGAYRWEGRFIARNPYSVLFVCGVITLACCAGFIKFEVEEDAERLYTPQDAPSFADRDYVDAMYPTTSTTIKLLSLDKRENGVNILTKEYLLEHLRAYNLITSQVIEKDGVKYTWGAICETTSPNSTECRVTSVLAYWNYSEVLLQNDPNILSTLNSRSVLDYLGRPVSFTWMLGGIGRDASGAVVSAEVFQTVFYQKLLQEDDEDSVAVKFQERVTEVAYDNWNSAIMAQYVSCDGAIGRESTKAINRDVSSLSIGYIILCIYTLIVFWRNSWAYQKIHVALGSFLAIGMGIVADLGMLSGFGVKFNFVCQVLPFLLVGVGVDNSFVILSNYFDQDPDAPIEHRMGEAMALGGSSITVSCMTNIIAFAVGTYTNLEALYSFSIYASVGTLLVFIFQVTVFPAILALDSRREMRARLGKGGCCGCVLPGCCQKEPAEEELQSGANGWTPETNVYKHAHASGSGSAATVAPTQQPPASRSDSSVNAMGVAVKVSVRPPSPEGLKPSATSSSLAAPQRDFTTKPIGCWGPRFNPHDDQLSTKIIARWLPLVSLSLWGKLVVVVLECTMVGFAIYGCTKVYMDFNFRELFVPEGNWLHEAYQVEDRFFGGEKVPVALYTRTPIDGRDYYYYQSELAALGPALASNGYITDVPPVVSWYANFQSWLTSPSSPYLPYLTPEGRAPNETAFNAWLKVWLETEGKGSLTNIVFNSTSGRIISSKIPAFTRDVVDGAWAVRCVDATRNTAESAGSGLDTIAYGPSYTFWDGFRTIARSTVVNVIIAAAAVFVVTLILLADILGCLAVFLMVVLSDVGVFGFMHYAGLTFNSVTCIVLVLAVGISVDYSCHVMRAFLVSTGTRQERAHMALVEIGGAVWNGAITTWLAVLPMAFAEHYIFRTIFQMWSVLILLSIWHGVLLLPVMLSWMGPPSYRDQDAKGAKEDPATAVDPV